MNTSASAVGLLLTENFTQLVLSTRRLGPQYAGLCGLLSLQLSCDLEYYQHQHTPSGLTGIFYILVDAVRGRAQSHQHPAHRPPPTTQRV